MVFKLSTLVTVLLLVLPFANASGQIIDSVNYAIDIGDTYGAPGSIVSIPILLKNALPIGGYLIRFEYDPDYVTPLISGAIPDMTNDELFPGISSLKSRTVVYDSVEMAGRGLFTITHDSGAYYCDPSITAIDTIYNAYAFHDPDDDSVHTDAIFVIFLPNLPPMDACELDYWHIPYVPEEPNDTTIIARVFFAVNEEVPGNSCQFTVADYVQETPEDPSPDYRIIQLVDTTYNVTIWPTGAFGSGNLYIDQAYVCGDANGDLKFDILDILFLINFHFFDGSAPAYDFLTDVNNDGALDLMDIYYLIAYKFDNGPPPACN